MTERSKEIDVQQSCAQCLVDQAVGNVPKNRLMSFVVTKAGSQILSYGSHHAPSLILDDILLQTMLSGGTTA